MIHTRPPIVDGTTRFPNAALFRENAEFRKAMIRMLYEQIDRAVVEHPERFADAEQLVLRWSLSEH